MWEKSCFDCKNAIVFEDRSVGIEAYVDDCKQGDKPEVQKFFSDDEGGLEVFDETKVASKCPYFEPHLYSECANCKVTINEPIYSWSLVVVGVYDELPVCSEKCKVELQKRVDSEIKEMTDVGY